LLSTSKKGAYSHGASLRDFTFSHSGFDLIDTSFDTNCLSVRLSRLLSRKIPIINGSLVFESQELGFDSRVYKSRKHSTLIGYFQSYKYLEDLHRQTGTPLSIFPKETSPGFDASMNLIKDTKPVAIHVRRGDYVGNRTTGILAREYYVNALEILEASDREVWVFSDDIKAAQEMLGNKNRKKWKFADRDLFGTTAESLYALSQFSDLVIANSTFSWWAASLNQESRVISPNKWFQNGDDPVDLISPKWISIDSKWV